MQTIQKQLAITKRDVVTKIRIYGPKHKEINQTFCQVLKFHLFLFSYLSAYIEFKLKGIADKHFSMQASIPPSQTSHFPSQENLVPWADLPSDF